MMLASKEFFFFFFQAEDGIRDKLVTGVQTCALPISLPQGGKIMVFVGTLDAANAQQRYQGLKETLQGSNIQILDVRTDNADRVRAKSNAADALVNHADLAGMVGLWAYNGPTILGAVRDAGRIG